MTQYSGNLLRMAAAQNPAINPGGVDASHGEPSGPDGVPDYRVQEITVPGGTGAEYVGTSLDDGVPGAVLAGQPSVGWDAPDISMETPGGGNTPNGWVPKWLRGDPHNAAVDTSLAHNAGATPLPANHDGNDSGPYTFNNPIVGVEGSSFLERAKGFPTEIWAEPTGPGADKFVAGTNSYRSSNPEGDQYAPGRGGARVHYGFESQYFVHQQMFIDKPNQFYERRTPPITATDPMVGGQHSTTPILGQLAANPWLTQLGNAAPVDTGYGVPVDGAI